MNFQIHFSIQSLNKSLGKGVKKCKVLFERLLLDWSVNKIIFGRLKCLLFWRSISFVNENLSFEKWHKNIKTKCWFLPNTNLTLEVAIIFSSLHVLFNEKEFLTYFKNVWFLLFFFLSYLINSSTYYFNLKPKMVINFHFKDSQLAKKFFNSVVQLLLKLIRMFYTFYFTQVFICITQISIPGDMLIFK